MRTFAFFVLALTISIVTACADTASPTEPAGARPVLQDGNTSTSNH